MTYKNKKIEGLARRYYDERLSYHNFNHALTAIKNGMKLVQRCKKEGIIVDEEIAYYALLFHDAGYFEDHRKKGFDTKEIYSSHIAGEVLSDENIPLEKIKKIQQAILSTHKDAKFNTNEEKIVRAADLFEVMGSYKKFFENTVKFKQECEFIQNRHISWSEWKINTIKSLSLYLSQDIHITKQYFNQDGQSRFHATLVRNIARLSRQKFNSQ